MLTPTPSEINDRILFTSQLTTPGEVSAHYRAVRHGDVVRLCRGAYMSSADWALLDRHARYRGIVYAATAFLSDDTVFSHHSAAALWRLPWLGHWPDRAHVTTEWPGGGKSTLIAMRHAWGVPEIAEKIDGVRVTSLARTVVDVARLLPFADAVVVADAALRRAEHPIRGVPRTALTRSDLADELALARSSRGVAKAREVLAFADGRADRPGESISRVNMHRMGITAPQLQVELRGASGRVYLVDFWWPQFGIIGEFDGEAKYTDPEFLRGRTPEQALLDEKDREDDLRAAGFGMTRWKWKIAISAQALATHLRRSGVR